MVKGGDYQIGAQRFFYKKREDVMTIKGFVDLHTHGSGRYDVCTEDPEHILKMAELHGSAGTGAILPTIYSGRIDEMRMNMEAVKKAMAIQKSSAKSGQPTAQILGVHLEGPFLNPDRCGALDRSSFSTPDLASLKRLTAGFEDIIKIITIAPEIQGALKVIERCSGLGIRVNMGHSDATYKEAAEGKKAGAAGITHIFNAMRPFHHREPGIAGLGLIDEDLYIEVIADGVHLHPRTLELIFACKRLDRIMLVSDSVKSRRKKGMPVYDETGTLAGSGITIADSFGLLRDIGIPDAEIDEAASDNPARYLGLHRPLTT